jgi:hypothetical protein
MIYIIILLIYILSILITLKSLKCEYKEQKPFSKEDEEADFIWALTPILNLFLINYDCLLKIKYKNR